MILLEYYLNLLICFILKINLNYVSSYKKISDYEDKTNAKIYNFITNVIKCQQEYEHY